MSRFDLEGVVFDVDGVLFDTERLSQETWNAVSTELNWPQVGRAYLEFVGQNRADILQKMLDLFGPDFPRETFLLTCSARSQARMEQEGVPLKPGVREILEFLTARGIPAALATSTNRERTHRRMEMTGLGPCFSAVVTGDQVEHSKPDPEIYQLACQALGTAPSRTLAIEDSRNGILSAHAAADLHNDILVVIGVLGQEQELKLSLQPLQLRVGLEQLLLSQLPHLRVGQQLLCLSQALPGGQIASIGFHHRAQFILFLIQTGHRGGVVIGLRGGQSCLDLAVFCLNGGKFLQHRNLQHWIFNGRPQAAKFLIPNS